LAAIAIPLGPTHSAWEPHMQGGVVPIHTLHTCSCGLCCRQIGSASFTSLAHRMALAGQVLAWRCLVRQAGEIQLAMPAMSGSCGSSCCWWDVCGT
jgi:hypothetical protein